MSTSLSPSGFKLSDVGPIPEDWKVMTLLDLGGKITSGSRGWARFYSEYGDLFVRITNMDRSTIYLDLTSPKFVTLPTPNAEAERTRLSVGDLLVSITADIGIIGYVDEHVPAPAYINQHIARVRFHGADVSSKFIAYYLSSWSPQRIFLGTTDTGAKAGMNLTAVAALQTIVPHLSEQVAIATVLEDIDELIATAGRLIDKKRSMKRGVMQELLSGMTRLPGFTGGWQSSRSLLDLCEKFTGVWGSDAPNKLADIPARVVRAGDISSDGRLINTADRYLSSSQWQKAKCQPDDLLITASGNGLGKTYHVHDSNRLAASNFVRILRPKPSVSGEYLSYVLRSTSAAWKLQMHTATSAYPNLLPSFFTEPWLSVPTYEEQLAIARTLRVIDGQIDKLQRRLEKAIQIRQGLMQELLTGRTRLSRKEPAL